MELSPFTNDLQGIDLSLPLFHELCVFRDSPAGEESRGMDFTLMFGLFGTCSRGCWRARGEKSSQSGTTEHLVYLDL